MWLQQFWLETGEVRLRETANMPSPGQRLHTPYDPQARYATKREIHWLGYKVHLTETCEPDSPNLITQVYTTAATVPDLKATAPIEQSLAARDLLPAKHMVDAGYVSSEVLLESKRRHHLEGVKECHSERSEESVVSSNEQTLHYVPGTLRVPQGWTIPYYFTSS